MSLKFDPLKGRAGEVIEAVMNAPEIPADMGLQFKIRLCVEEIVENVANYAYPDSDGFIEIETLVEDGYFIVVVKDGGIQFDPLAKADPDVTLSVEDRDIGGLGIFLCKQMMDSVSYRYEDGYNILTMKIKS